MYVGSESCIGNFALAGGRSVSGAGSGYGAAPAPTCRQAPRQECKNVPQQQCSNVPRQDCKSVGTQPTVQQHPQAGAQQCF